MKPVYTYIYVIYWWYIHQTVIMSKVYCLFDDRIHSKNISCTTQQDRPYMRGSRLEYIYYSVLVLRLETPVCLWCKCHTHGIENLKFKASVFYTWVMDIGLLEMSSWNAISSTTKFTHMNGHWKPEGLRSTHIRFRNYENNIWFWLSYAWILFCRSSFFVDIIRMMVCHVSRAAYCKICSHERRTVIRIIMS